jgi:hypothetical protein
MKSVAEMSNTSLRIAIATESPRFGWKNTRLESGRLVGNRRRGLGERVAEIPNWPEDFATAVILWEIMEVHGLKDSFATSVKIIAGITTPSARQLSEAAVMTIRDDAACAAV